MSAENEERGMTIPTPSGSLLPDWWVKVAGPGVMFKTTLDLKSPENRKVLLRSINEDAQPGRDRINTELAMVGYTISPAGKEENGELREWVRCVLHLADGTNVACGSFGVLKSLMVIEQLDRRAPWNPPLIKVLRSKGVDGGKQWYYLTDPPETAKQLPKGKVG